MSPRYTNSRIRRGVLAADRFTQVSNALFRDTRISLKAKGLFGLLSTHRDGYGVTAALIARQCKEGISAVESGLRELERYGYLERERERRPDGTLGAVEYFITDAPAEDFPERQSPRSEPNRDFPGLDKPGLDDRPPKNTQGEEDQQAEDEGTDSVRPCADGSRETVTAVLPDDGGTDGHHPPLQEPVPVPKVQRSEGVELLLAIGGERPGFLLTGRTLRDQGLMVDGMLVSGWTPGQIRHLVAGRPLPEKLERTVGAIVSKRLRDAVAAGPPLSAPVSEAEPRPAPPADPCPAHPWKERAGCRPCRAVDVSRADAAPEVPQNAQEAPEPPEADPGEGLVLIDQIRARRSRPGRQR